MPSCEGQWDNMYPVLKYFFSIFRTSNIWMFSIFNVNCLLSIFLEDIWQLPQKCLQVLLLFLCHQLRGPLFKMHLKQIGRLIPYICLHINFSLLDFFFNEMDVELTMIQSLAFSYSEYSLWSGMYEPKHVWKREIRNRYVKGEVKSW